MTNSTTWNPASYSKNARFVSDLGEPVLQLLAPRSGELILDLGCGDGALTEKIAAAGCQVIGVDSSAAQIGAARQRGLNAVVMNGHQLAFTCALRRGFQQRRAALDEASGKSRCRRGP